MRISMRDYIKCSCGAGGEDLVLIQNCPIVYECQVCPNYVEVSCGNIDCMDCVDTYPENKDDCER